MQSITGRSGFVVILGRPSTGKSTLINAICREKVSIVSPIPQTTRNTIRGIYNDSRGQIVFLDTPGLHQAEKKINLRMRGIVSESLRDAETLVYTVDTTRTPGTEEEQVVEIVNGTSVPRIIVLTKGDHPESEPDKIHEFLRRRECTSVSTLLVGGLSGERGSEQPQAPSPARTPAHSPQTPPSPAAPPTGSSQKTAIVPVSTVIDTIFPLLPEGTPYYPDDRYTDQDPRFRISEIVREQAILRVRQEVPHALYVETADLEHRERGLWARVFILVERSSQQGILVGKKGVTITAIRRESERVLRSLFFVPVRLSVQVKVRSRWRRDDTILNSLIH